MSWLPHYHLRCQEIDMHLHLQRFMPAQTMSTTHMSITGYPLPPADICPTCKSTLKFHESTAPIWPLKMYKSRQNRPPLSFLLCDRRAFDILRDIAVMSQLKNKH